MAVLSRTGKAVRPTSKVRPLKSVRSRVDEDENEEVETKEETQTVVVPKPLADIVSKWGAAQGQADLFFARVVNLVIEEDFNRNEVYQALVEHRGMKPITANTEASVIMRVKGFPAEVKRALGGKMTIRDLRECGKTKRDSTSPEGSPERAEKKLSTVLKNIAKFAIMEIGYEKSDFVSAAKTAYTVADGLVLKAKEKADAEQEGEAEVDENLEDEFEDETEDETEE